LLKFFGYKKQDIFYRCTVSFCMLFWKKIDIFLAAVNNNLWVIWNENANFGNIPICFFRDVFWGITLRFIHFARISI